MALSTKDAIIRFDENEERINKFVNSYGTYTSNSGLGDVETLPSFMQRNSNALNLLTATNVKGSWTASTAYSVWDEVQYSGTWYRCVVAHTSTGTFDSTKWRISQGIRVGDLSADNGDSLVGHKSDATGAISTTVNNKLKACNLNAVIDFGCDNTGTTNTTAALKAFYDACISNGVDGKIPAGTYKITPGVLKFYSGGIVDKFLPNIYTEELLTQFLVDTSSNVDAPILEFTNVLTNGTQSSYTYTYWKGGSHGGFSVIDNSSDNAPNRVGLQLTGIWYTKFGVIIGKSLRSDLIRLPFNALAGNNPDPFSCAFLKFNGLSSFSCQGKTVNNLNTAGMDSWEVDSVSSVYDIGGVWFGIGQGCVIKQFSVYGSSGWAFDDGTQNGNTVGNRLQILVAEFDNPQNGIRINKLSDFEIKFIRFNHRYNFSPLNTSNKYWPLVCIDVTGGSSPNVNRGEIKVFNRIESGSTLSNLGQFLNCHSGANILDLTIDVDYADNGNLGVTDSWITANANISRDSAVKITKKHKNYLILLSKIFLALEDLPQQHLFRILGLVLHRQKYRFLLLKTTLLCRFSMI